MPNPPAASIELIDFDLIPLIRAGDQFLRRKTMALSPHAKALMDLQKAIERACA